MSRFDSLNDLYNDYQDEDIDIYVMGIGQNNATPITQMTASNNLPWVKENSSSNVWSTWEALNRDLYIMDRYDEIVVKVNLTDGFDGTYIKSIINGI